MRRTRKSARLPSDDSEDDKPLMQIKKGPTASRSKKLKTKPSDDSSSESDIENYLQPIDKLNFDSPFFDLQKTKGISSNDKGNNDTHNTVSRLSDSDSGDEDDTVIKKGDMEIKAQENEEKQNNHLKESIASKLNFQQLHEYTKKLEEAKKHVEQYNARRQADQENKMDILNMLVTTETKANDENNVALADLHSSDFESGTDSEKEGWEEVKNKDTQKDKSVVPKEGLQITVEMPNTIKKKKGTDLIAAMKRRLNRIRKENQLLIHKVHLLCWIAHGNYVSSVINNEKILALSLSLIPSQQCYPEDRTDLKYLDQILQWYRKTVKNVEKVIPPNLDLNTLLQLQIKKKEVYNKKMWVYVFITILRSLGIQCRLVLSFQVEPLRPPNSELCSLSTKIEDQKEKKKVIIGKKGESSKKKGDDVKKSLNIRADEKDRSSKNASIKQTDKNKPSTSKTSTKKTTEDTTFTVKSKKGGTSGKKNLKEVQRKVLEEKSKIVKPRKPSNKEQSDKDSLDTKSKLQVLKPNTRRCKSTSVEPSNSQNVKSDYPRSMSVSEKPSKSAKNKNRDLLKMKGSQKSDLTNTEVGRNLRRRNKESSVPQVDGTVYTDESEDEYLMQVDGANDKRSKKPNLKKLKQETPSCPVKTHPKRSKSSALKYKDTSSEDDFAEELPARKSNVDGSSSTRNGRVNLKKVSTKSPVTSENGRSKFFKNKAEQAVDVRDDIIHLVKGRIKEQKVLDRGKTAKVRTKRSESEDSDYVPEAIQKKHHDSDDEFVPKTKVKQRVQVKSSRKVLSSDSGDEKGANKKKGIDVWAEVFLEVEEKWISVDVVQGKIHCENELYKRANHPVSYVVAWNNDNSIKDITARYCQNFNTVTRKLRIDAKWWEETVKSFMGKKTPRDKEEDKELETQQLEKPLPTSIAEYKNHPLYVLKRHLLKFEGLYPPDTPTLGFVRNEPVYSRQCVYTLHSRDIWLKHAKVVKLGEKPYKIVKARPKYDKLSNTVITDQLLEIFGPWQTEDYVPPTAENGIVPRNAFGNVELFKACMLPKKTVHLQLPGLNKIARRMNIDCASAIVGFDFHSGWSHPTYDGFVVCEEFADILIAAWELEQEELEKREQEKIEKRVYGNWRKLIRGLLIRERLKAKYDFGEPSGQGGKEKKAKGPRFVAKKRRICSDSESE